MNETYINLSRESFNTLSDAEIINSYCPSLYHTTFFIIVLLLVVALIKVFVVQSEYFSGIMGRIKVFLSTFCDTVLIIGLCVLAGYAFASTDYLKSSLAVLKVMIVAILCIICYKIYRFFRNPSSRKDFIKNAGLPDFDSDTSESDKKPNGVDRHGKED